MKRDVEEALVQWKNSQRRKPLIVRGARQVGKTYSVKRFGEKYFPGNIVTIDLERNRNFHRVFEDDLDPRRITADFEVLLDREIRVGETLLFFDEIQACPRAVTALRYFHEEMSNLQVVAAGSLLELALEDIAFPVGRVQFLEMYPLSFREYLKASGREKAAHLLGERPSKLPEPVHRMLLDELHRYFFIGGMPESVKAYIETGSIKESFKVHEEIIETYVQDFSKYAPYADKRCLESVFRSVGVRVGRQIKYAHLAEGYSNPTIKKAFELLVKARVIHQVPSVNPAGLPLGRTASPKRFKALTVDIGLMARLCGMSLDREYAESDLLNIYRGAAAEQFVGQEMMITQKRNLYYWSRAAKSSSAEVDYLAEINGRIVPVEVKAGSSGRLKSMHMFLNKHQESPGGYVFSTAPYSESPEHKLTFVPLYFAYSATAGL